jgi:hypothetical protein
MTARYCAIMGMKSNGFFVSKTCFFAFGDTKVIVLKNICYTCVCFLFLRLCRFLFYSIEYISNHLFLGAILPPHNAFRNRATGIFNCSRYLATVRRAML